MRRDRTAHHEAGHWVASHVFGFLVCGPTIKPNKDAGTLGHVTPLEDPDSSVYSTEAEWVERVEQWVVSLYAGFAADVHYCPDGEAEAREGSWGDDEHAEESLERVGRATEADRQRLRGRAAALVAEHWPAIARIAAELLEHETLDETESAICTEIVRGEATEVDLARYRMLREAAGGG